MAEVTAAQKALAPAVKRLTKALKAADLEKLVAAQLGAAADLLYELRNVGKMLGSLTASFDDVVGPAVKTLENAFVDKLAVGEASGVQGMAARVQVTESVVPVPEDWDKIYKYIKKNDAFELLGRSLKRDAIMERWDQRKQIPGVGKFHAKRVSCTKLGGK